MAQRNKNRRENFIVSDVLMNLFSGMAKQRHFCEQIYLKVGWGKGAKTSMGQKMCPTEKRKMASSFEHLLDFGIVLTKLKTYY